MKHTCLNRVLSALMVLVMVFGILPATAIPARAEAFQWNDSATLTLTVDGVEIAPSSVVETEDTKLKVYTIDSDKAYKLASSPDNDYAVVLNVQWVKTGEDQYGNEEFDTELDLELDNVTIRTYNPRQDGFTAFAAMRIDNADERYGDLNLTLTGENTVELLGVQNDTAEDSWSAVGIDEINTVIKGSGSLQAKVAYENAVGQVSAISIKENLTTEETAVVHAIAAAGNGITVESGGVEFSAGTVANITAGETGLVFQGAGTMMAAVNGELNIKAGECGIDWQSYKLFVGDGAKLSVTGLAEGAAPKTGVLTFRGVEIGANCVVSVDASNEAFSCTATNVTTDYTGPISIGENSVVTVTGTTEFGGFAIDCGTKTAHNSYWAGASYPASTLTLAAGAKLTVNSGYRALQALSIDMAEGSAIYVTATEQYNSNSEYECTPVYISSKDSYIREGATFQIDTVSEYAINGYTKLNLQSDDIYFKCTGKVFYSTSFVCAEGIVALQSADGNLWRPTTKTPTMAYLTTRKVENHECHNDTVTPIEGQGSHAMVCLYCGEETAMACQWDYGSWKDTSAGILRFQCKLCKQEKLVNVAYHSHTYENWIPMVGTVNQQHEAFCTYPGCGAGTSGYCSSYLGEEYHIGVTTMRRDCARCGQFTTRELTDVTTKHVEAKAASCSAPGNVEYWSCGHCNKYFADANCTTELSPLDAFITPGQHNYENGVCTACGDKPQTLSFWQADGGLYDYHNYNFVLVGKDAEGKLYVMGNQQADGKRKGLEIPEAWIDENGILTVSSQYAEYMLWDYMNDGFLVDGGYLSLLNRAIFVYGTDSRNDSNVPYPAVFNPYDYSDGTGLGNMSAYISGKYSEREYLVFNAETKTFEVSDTEEDSLYIYVQLCDHPNMAHNEASAPTCTEQGGQEYWYCDKCGDYYSNPEGTVLLELPEYSNPAEVLTLPALNHTFGADDRCVNCGMERPVYSKITTLEEYDALGGNAYYLIVFETGDKTYAAALPPQNHYWDDMNGDGELDLFVMDENTNGIPDCIENVDFDENGVLDILEDWTYDEEIGSSDDYMRIYEQLAYAADEAMYTAPNFVEVTKAADGTITLADEGAMELQMITAGIWGGQEIRQEDFEYANILENERIRAMWVPNYWISAGGQLSLWGPEQFRMSYRVYGDKEFPGLIDMKNWKLSFREDGTVCMVDGWSEYYDDAALQLVKYTNDMGEEALTVFGAPETEWEYSSVASQIIETYPAYLYAAEPAGAHVCSWGEWQKTAGAMYHIRVCEGCGATQQESHEFGRFVSTDTENHMSVCAVCSYELTEQHNWDEGNREESTCERPGSITYTCYSCGEIRVEEIPADAHIWGSWMPENETQHGQSCGICGTIRYENHEITEDWISVDEVQHGATCHICYFQAYEDHSYEEVGNQPAGCTTVGEVIYACSGCQRTYSEEIPATGHSWGEWETLEDGGHRRTCGQCGIEELLNLPEDKPVNNTPTDNAANSNLAGDAMELIEQILTDEEQSQVAAGAEVSVFLVVADISEEVSNEDVAAVEEIKAEEDEIGMYLDIDLFKQVDTEETQVTETNKEVAITIEIPEQLRNTDAGVTRSYKIIRVHRDESGAQITDVLEGEFDPITNTFTFHTDKFSTYVLVYTDTKSPSVPGDLNADTKVTNDDVLLLLWHTLFPEENPVSVDVDFNKDTRITNDDVLLLLWHCLFPEENPLC